MKRFIQIVVLGLILLLQGCVVYDRPYGYGGYYGGYGYRPYYGGVYYGFRSYGGHGYGHGWGHGWRGYGRGYGGGWGGHGHWH